MAKSNDEIVTELITWLNGRYGKNRETTISILARKMVDYAREKFFDDLHEASKGIAAAIERSDSVVKDNEKGENK